MLLYKSSKSAVRGQVLFGMYHVHQAGVYALIIRQAKNLFFQANVYVSRLFRYVGKTSQNPVGGAERQEGFQIKPEAAFSHGPRSSCQHHAA